ncbi:MAG: acyltransferase [Prevotella sp.]|nr:acyltransferase [Prevotella sp.]
MKVRDVSVDIVKFLAVFLIINSHADIAYPKLSILATGGAIGDALFLFCSGFTLFIGKSYRFDAFYKRRVNRIYPSVFATLVMMLLLSDCSFGTISLVNFIGRPFIVAIMIYYALLWFVRKYFHNRIPLMFLMTMVVTLIAYYFFPYKYETSGKGIYGITTLFRWIPYFGAMLLGAHVGKIRERLHFHFKWDCLKFMGCLVCFYTIQFISKMIVAIAPYQIVTIIFLYGIVYYLYKCCNASFLRRIYETKAGNKVIMVVGGLCLESYLIQYCVITDKLNFLFPLNIPIIIVGVLALAYITRCLARLFSQTFRTEDYEWGKVFSLM